MQATIVFWCAVALIGLAYYVLSKVYRKQFAREKTIIHYHHKRRTFLRSKLLHLFEIEKKHLHRISILENEVEQLQQEIAEKQGRSTER